ncbi:phage late control D family protein [Halomonas sp. PBN3]|uniref:phage late control D family protein n=1 Tax=Halomonas sp. PBN3 TaxID=1397528 RepID=UPI0003B85D6D|nr:phage late control D family protein [Halomonas sp. PBN3]ERS88728.1 late control protein D [Halomonas sp. PBN3]
MIPTAYQGRPARRPSYRLTLAGQVISPELEGRLMRLRLTDRRGLEADQLDITLADHDGRLALPRHGAELTLALGWAEQGLVERGTFIVDEVEHAGAPDALTIRARSADMRQRLPGKRSQSWHELTLADIVTTIAGRHGLEPAIGATLQGVYLEHIDQTDESDLHFLTRLAEQFDAIATIKAGNLLFMPAGQAATASGQPIPPVTLSRNVGDSHRYVEADREAFTGVLAYWHDPDAAERAEVIAGSDENLKRLRHTYATRDDAVTAAKSEWQRLQRGGAECSLTLAEGRPDLYPETPVRLQGFKAEIDARPWLITEVTHELTDTAYTGGITLEIQGS